MNQGAQHQPSKILTFIEAWSLANQERTSEVFHQLISKDLSRQQTFSIGGALRAAIGYADGFQKVLKLKTGDRIAILADGFGELVPVYHALWLLGCTVVAVPHNIDIGVTISQINNCDCKVVLYAPAIAAKMAAMMSELPGVSSWIVVGGQRSTSSTSSSAAVRLEDVFQAGSRTRLLSSFTTDIGNFDPALIVFTSGESAEPRGVSFSQEKLIAAAQIQAGVYSQIGKEGRICSFLPDKHLISLVHMLIVPLVRPVSSGVLLDVHLEAKNPKFISELLSHEMAFAWITQEHLGFLRLAGRTERFMLAKFFRAICVLKHPIHPTVLEHLNDLVIPCYAQTESGGLVSVGAKEGRLTSTNIRADKSEVLSVGYPLPGIHFKIVSSNGLQSPEHKTGELIIESEQTMSQYVGTEPGPAFVGPDLSLHTADRAQWAFNSDGRPQLFIVGRDEQFVTRGGKEVSLIELESVIRQVIGVKDARVVGFHHFLQGKEIGAFVLLEKKAQVTREILWANVLRFFPWELVPKVFMIAETGAITAIPSRKLIEDKFLQFSKSDFSKAPKL